MYIRYKVNMYIYMHINLHIGPVTVLPTCLLLISLTINRQYWDIANKKRISLDPQTAAH